MREKFTIYGRRCSTVGGSCKEVERELICGHGWEDGTK